MGKVPAYHAKGSSVYHDHSACTEGNNIEARNKQQGRGGRRHCKTCEGLFKK